jgi:hypothetical protein
MNYILGIEAAGLASYLHSALYVGLPEPHTYTVYNPWVWWFPAKILYMNP